MVLLIPSVSRSCSLACIDISPISIISDSLKPVIKLDGKSVMTCGSSSVICSDNVELLSKLLELILDTLPSMILLSKFTKFSEFIKFSEVVGCCINGELSVKLSVNLNKFNISD
ncbi:hypothetical protein SR1949_33890 [Sphaerospermopsis reniformis]|uniref:Uncharacterized protein n=1 Tax=Sphaerospermopsis reniformis TaxID=531300 RepID=A0A480A005_9CYAN|nr:hypothetical protein SR1949_33890 [Sphaerospermopsis reniformis]